jgi:hypothetical protein
MQTSSWTHEGYRGPATNYAERSLEGSHHADMTQLGERHPNLHQNNWAAS